MKIKFLLFAAAVAAMSLAGCAKDEPEVQGNPDPSIVEGSGTMNLSLAYATGTRANNDFEYGTGAESLVKEMEVYFFDEGGLLLGNVPADLGFEGSGNGGCVEKMVDVEVVVPDEVVTYLWTKGNENKKAGIVVVLNKGGVVLPAAKNTSYATFNAALSKAVADVTADDGFMMTSTNYFTAEKEEAALTLITRDNVGVKSNTGSTPAEPVTVAVERVAAKVTVKTGANAAAQVLAWGLNVTNKKFFPVKTFTTDFVKADGSLADVYAGQWPMENAWNAPVHRRSHWAVDPNYISGAVTTGSNDDFNLIDLSAAGATVDAGVSLYCLENTFDEARQRMPSTTTAVIVAQFIPEDVEISGGDNTWVRWENHNFTAAAFVTVIVDKAKEEVQKYYYKVTNEKPEGDELPYKFIRLTEDNFKIGVDDATKEITINGKVVGYNGSADVMLGAREGDIENGKLYTLKENEDGKEPEDWQEAADAATKIAEALADAIGDEEPVVYKDGYCYYEVPIRHFNDSEVPCDMTTVNQPEHLGRYGIVRNNSYVLTVNSVKTPGKPVTGGEIIPEDIPDDNPEYYLDVDIEVLSWNVRNQEVDL